MCASPLIAKASPKSPPAQRAANCASRKSAQFVRATAPDLDHRAHLASSRTRWIDCAFPVFWSISIMAPQM